MKLSDTKILDRLNKAKDTITQSCAKVPRMLNIMEVCGTHTVSIFRNGIKPLLPKNLKLLSGPGCPVCVTNQGYIDLVLRLADRENCLIATYGDMIRVPGSTGSLEKRKSTNIRVVLSSEDALKLAKDNPYKDVVFVAVGFETTTPATAVAIKEAFESGINNFYVLSGHKLVVPAMRALLSAKNDKIDAFLCPGHVSVITGYCIFNEIVKNFGRPCVVAGFEPLQILEGLACICQQLADKKAELKSVYSAAVTESGNAKARELVNEYFEPCDGYWRGLGEIKESTLKLKDKYSKFDAFKHFNLQEDLKETKDGCRCGEVVCGLIDPPQCHLFGKKCTPQEPIGPCMVSSEGACAAWYKYGQNRKISS